MKNTPFIEALKEALRYSVFLAFSSFVSILLQRLTSFESKDTYIVALTIVLRVLDKYLHEARKDKKFGFQSKPSGLLPF